MSKQSDEAKNYQAIDENEDIELSSTVEVSYIISTILDYYAATGSQQSEEGEEWKELDPEKYISKRVVVPSELDKEIKKTFIVQIKKFQK